MRQKKRESWFRTLCLSSTGRRIPEFSLRTKRRILLRVKRICLLNSGNVRRNKKEN